MQTKIYHRRTLGWGCNANTFLILLNVLVIALVLLLTIGNPGRKWLETRSYQGPEVRTYDDHRYVEEERTAFIKTAKIVDKSLIVAPAPKSSTEYK